MARLKGLALAGKVQADRLAAQPEVQKRGQLRHAFLWIDKRIALLDQADYFVV